ncbi:MAG TPA: malate dehydrogenase [Syntrophales bacterium]|nr:malate dehydrogenase [Syntrophales bacterium]HOX95171.1 malate dehydrogenase [Syntrophales bacterium]HPI58056.1 malate dehydrogenase [Syntrophales bacterium]HPN25272.1 malate dehydrogenase [Syntrophales bacterium]HQM29309.1 malate dehydrogenase [Syntrophales bacterium]
MNIPKVSVVGAGFVGTMTAQRIVEHDLAHVVLVDIVEGMPQGKALDIAQSAGIEGFDVKITGTNDFSEIRGSRIVVVTAGFARLPGMSREELAAKNGKIIQSVTERVKTYAPECILLMVTNPVDVMTQLAWKVSGFPAHRVVGMGGVLDSARYQLFLAEELGVAPREIEALVLGGHGDSMVPVGRRTTLKGVPVGQLVKPERHQAIIERTRYGGAEIIGLLKTGSAFHAPSAAVFVMVEAILRDSKRVVPASTYLDGQYGIRGCFIGIPVKLGAGGVEDRYEIELTAEERDALRRSAERVEKTFNELRVT